jgi:MATE family multidrug resistance protein
MADPITHRRVLKIALPIVLSNATVPILGAVDTGVVGQMGAAAPIGAVGIGAVILTSIYWVWGFLRMGTTGLTAQAAGQGDQAEVAALLLRALLIGGAAGLALIALQTPLFWLGFRLSPATQEVEVLARAYMQVRIWSAPAAIAAYGINGWLIARERTRAVLAIQLWTNGVNILLDLWFVLGLGWGVPGVALATFLAEWLALGLGLWLCRHALARGVRASWAQVFDARRLRRMALVNGDIMIRSVLLLGIFASFMFLGAGFGDQTLAANQILMQFLNITAYALDGFAFAAEAIVGQALGGRSLSHLRRGAVLASVWGAGSAVALALAFALAGGPIVDLMTTSLPVRAEARDYLPWMVAAPVLGVTAWMFDGIFIGATRTADMRNMMALSVLVYAAALGVCIPLLGNHGLWLALSVSFVARGATLAWRYPRIEAEARG